MGLNFFLGKTMLKKIDWIESIAGHRLSLDERRQILEGDWLNDAVINASQGLLALQFPRIKGLRDTLYYDLEPVGKTTRWDRLCSLRQQMNKTAVANETGRQVQAVHLPGHWVSLSNRHSEAANIVYVMDSLALNLHKDLPHLVAAVFRFSEESFSIRLRRSAQQTDGSSCGVYTVAFLTTDCYGEFLEKKILEIR